MENLNDYSIEELEEAIEIKKQIDMTIPKIVDHPAFDTLQKCCESYIQEIIDKKGVDSDSDHYVFECAMEAYYGKDIFKWINKRIT